ILAAIAIPAYQDYIIRSKVSEAEAALGACKTSVTEYAQVNTAFPADIAAAGCSSTVTKYVSAVPGTAGVMAATIQGTNGGADPDGKTITFTPDGPPVTKWDCTTNASKK